MYLLTELVRVLEQRGYSFAHNADALTQWLTQADGDVYAKLHRRAALLDSDKQLAQRLHAYQHRLHALLMLASVIWFAIGFTATYGLMQHSSLNFFLLLVAILGINSVMLLVWLLSLVWHKNTVWLPLNTVFSGSRDSVMQAITQLYVQMAQQPNARWRRGCMTHRLALCGLLGMFVCALLLLTVREYQFTLESTLLNSQHFAKIVAILAWLPQQFGFATPHIATSVFPHEAALWGSLLLGSIVGYGCVPRALAWAFCAWQCRRVMPQLDLSLPYYQNIVQKWQQCVIDDDADYWTDVPQSPKIALNVAGAYWAVLLENAAQDDWFMGALGQDWVNKGSVAERAAMAVLLDELAHQPVQLLVGVRVHRVPDRGMVRQLAKLNAAAQAGIVVRLLLPSDDSAFSGSLNDLTAQWYEVLRCNAWAWIV